MELAAIAALAGTGVSVANTIQQRGAMKKAEAKNKAMLDSKSRLAEGGRGGLAYVDEDLGDTLGNESSMMGGQIRRAISR